MMATYSQILADIERVMKSLPPAAPEVHLWPSELMTEAETRTKTIDRSIKERFFSWPWRPFVKTKVVTYTVQVPSKQMYEIDGRSVGAGNMRLIVCHPAMAEKVRLACIGTGFKLQPTSTNAQE